MDQNAEEAAAVRAHLTRRLSIADAATEYVTARVLHEDCAHVDGWQTSISRVDAAWAALLEAVDTDRCAARSDDPQLIGDDA